MKKYCMLIATVLMLLLTTAAYKYENNVHPPQFKQPSVSIESQRFGLIKKIIWTTAYMDDNNSLIILSSRSSEQGDISYVYRLNIDTGQSNHLAEFPTHKNLKDVVLFDNPMGPNYVISAYDKGIIRINYPTDNPGSASQDRIDIAGFETATSMDLKGNLVYTLENDSLLYVKNLSMGSFMGFFNNNTVKDLTTFFVKPLYVGNFNSLDNMISYTVVNKNRIDLYAMQDGVPVTKLNTPIIKNVVSVKGIEDTFGFAGMNIASESKNNNKLNVFMLRRTIDKYNNDDYYSLDTISNNTDSFGAVPSFDTTTYNQQFSVVYTSYDENHKGTLKICGLNEQPRVIVSGENIFGPITMTQTIHDDTASASILYFTKDNGNTRIKICDGKGNLIKDITDMLLKNSST